MEDETLSNIRIKEMAMLNEIGRAISSTIIIDDLIELIYEQTTRIMEVSAFYIALYMAESDEMKIIFDVLNGKRQPGEERTRKLGNGRTEYIIRNMKPLLIKSNPQKVYQKLGIISGDKKAKACVGVPMIFSGKAIGALVVQSYKVDEAYDQHHVELLSTIASQAAIAIENAHLFKTIEERNLDLVKAKKETDNILNNVKDGLFLLNENNIIASQYSASLERIFEQENLGGLNLVEFLEGKIIEKEHESLSEFTDLLFKTSVDEQSIYDLNPISQTQFLSKINGRKKITKDLTFDFKRIYQENIVEDVIVSVNDITEHVTLQKKLQTTTDQNKKQMEWLIIILNMDGQILDEFMKSADEELEVLHSIKENKLTIDKLNDVYRAVHTIKGNASMLDLNFISEEAHTIEDKIIQAKENSSGGMVTVEELDEELNKLSEIFIQIKHLIERISQFHSNFRPTRNHETEMLFKSLERLVSSNCEKYGKKVHLDYTKYDPSIVPHQYRMLIRDILVQLIRNSIYHGIENSEDRKSSGKKEEGIISISNLKKKNVYYCILEDDGQGIRIDELKKIIDRTANPELDNFRGASDKKISQLIFNPGITTTNEADVTAGRGMGMDIIKKKLEKIGGSIDFDFKAGEFTRFTVNIPIA